MATPDHRTIGYRCTICSTWFMLKERHDEHFEAELPVFVARSALRRQAAEARFRARQVEIGRMRPDGTWVKDWRPGIVDRGPPPLELNGDEE